MKDDEVMLYVDGELPPEREEKIAGRPDLEGRKRSLELIGEAVRAHFDAALDQADTRCVGLWTLFEARLEERSWLGKVWERIARRRGYVLTALAGAAAGAFLVTWTTRGRVTMTETRRELPAPQVKLKARSAVIEGLEVFDGSATLFRIPGEEATVTVVWIQEDPDQAETEEDPI